MSQQNWIGQTIGERYEISELLGQGGMSAVYKANDPNLRRVVAVKLIHPHLSTDPAFVHRFEEEAATVASLRHPNIIQVFDFNHDGGTYYIVFEFVPGESLQAHLKRLNDVDRLMPYSQTVESVASVADALDYAHGRGMVHRDIKPANIMLNVQGQSILMDFGVVKIIGGDTHTATGAVMGTARYISPEQIKSSKVDGRTDIYSLGITLFEMVGGRPPFQADSALTIMMMHVNDPVPDLRQMRQDVPEDLALIINKSMAKDPDDRYQTAGELATALRSARLDAPVDKGTVIIPAGAAVTAAVAATGPASEPVVPAPVMSTQEPSGTSTAAATQLQPEATTPTGRNVSKIAIFGGIGAAVLLIICIAAVAIGGFASGIFSGNGGDGESTETAVAAALETLAAEATENAAIAGLPTPTPTEELIEPSPTATPTATDLPTVTASPTYTAQATTAATSTATHTPVPPPTTAPPTAAAATEPTGPRIRIDNITSDGTSYIVNYTPIGYTPALPGTHIHFFWNTVPPQNAGVGPTQESWIVYGGPNPFTQYKVSDRPGGATQMCALVANPNHTVQPNTGNCAPLP